MEASRVPFGGEHVSGRHLEWLIRNSVETEPEEEIREAAKHVAACPECQERMALYRAQSERLAALGHAPGQQRADCPGTEVWMNLAAGILETSEAEHLLEHAASCAFCGEELKSVMDILHSDELPDEAGAALTAGFRRQVVEAVSSEPASVGPERARWRAFWPFPVWSFAAVAATIVVVSIGIAYWSTRKDAAALLAMAYSADRTLEIQFPGATYAPLRVRKGSGEDPKSETSMLEAELAILRGLEREPDSPKWLQLQGRLDLLRWRYDRAVNTLERASRLQPSNDSILLDLGDAYLLRGIEQNSGTDLHKAVESLSRGIRDSKVSQMTRLALFNRAIALEQLQLWVAAEGDWKHYLELDADSGWAREARNHLERIQAKKRSWLGNQGALQVTPASFIEESPRCVPVCTEIALDRTLSDWLNVAYSLRGPESALANKAVRKLADLLIDRHQDYWMRDFLSREKDPRFPAALASLAAAIRANAAGLRHDAEESARRAEQLFVNGGNVAGSLRARVELVYALSRDFRSSECLQAASGVAESLAQRNYRWAYGQLQLERSTCSVRIGELGAAEAILNDAVDNIRRAGYPILLLRGLGLSADLLVAMGRYREAAQQSWEGLRLFWAGTYPPNRGYQFYATWSLVAEREKLWELGYLVSQDAVPLMERSGPPSTLGMARFRAALFAGMTDRLEAMHTETAKADEILNRAADHGVRSMRAENELLAASYYLESGRVELAKRVLEAVRAGDLADSIFFQLTFHQERGTVALRGGQFDEGRKELTDARRLAESALGKVRTARDRANWKRTAGPVYRQLVRLALDRDHDSESALALWEQFRSASIGGSGADRAADLSATVLRRWASQYRDASVLTFAQLDDRFAGWLYDNRGIYAFRSGLSATELAGLCDAFQTIAARTNSPVGQLRDMSRRIYNALILPIEDRLEPGRLLLVEADGACGGIPFEILTNRRGEYLVDRFAMATSPGLVAERVLNAAEQTVPSGLHALIIDNPKLGASTRGELPPLPGFGEETDFVLASFPSHERLTGAAATLPAVISALPKAEVLYFGGHGASDSEDGGVLLASDSGSGNAILNASRLEPAIRHCRLAILSACSTARGERSGGFNPDSLIQAFWRAGVPNVLATRWEVESRVTAEVIPLLVRGVLSGQPPALALRMAVREIRRKPEFEHPALWAAFHVFGVSSPLKEKGR